MVHYIIADVDKGKPIYWDNLDMNTCKDKDDYLKKIDIIEKKVVVNAFDKLINEFNV